MSCVRHDSFALYCCIYAVSENNVRQKATLGVRRFRAILYGTPEIGFTKHFFLNVEEARRVA